MASRLERAAAASGEQHGQIVVRVRVAVGDAAAIDDHAIVEERALAFAHGLQAFEEVGELRHVEAIDLRQLRLLLRIAAVVRDVVMAIGHAGEGVAAVAAIVGHHESGDPGGVGLESEGEEVEHDAEVLFVIARHAGGRGVFGRGHGEALGAFEALLNLADAGEVFVELLLVADAESGAELPGVGEDEVENALVRSLAADAGFGSFAGRAVGEQSLEDETWVHLGRERGGGSFPREIELILATVAGVAGAGLLALVAAQFERGQARLIAQARGGDLIDRHADAHILGRSLAGLRAGEERRGGARVVARAVTIRIAHALGEAREDLQFAPMGGEWFEDVRQREISAVGGGRPVFHVHTIGHIHEGHAERGATGGRGESGHHRVEHGQREGGAEAFEKRAPWNLPFLHKSLLVLRRNGNRPSVENKAGLPLYPSGLGERCGHRVKDGARRLERWNRSRG